MTFEIRDQQPDKVRTINVLFPESAGERWENTGDARNLERFNWLLEILSGWDYADPDRVDAEMRTKVMDHYRVHFFSFAPRQ
jgi:hypothetical protein